MKKIIILLLLITTCNAFSQTSIGKAHYKFTYLLTHQPDSTNSDKHEREKMILLVGNKASMFTSQGTYLRDSLLNTFKEENPAQILLKIRNLPSTHFKAKIYKNYPTGKITVTEKVMTDHFTYTEPLVPFDWTLLKETKKIGKYTVQKATTNYAGRHYTAWFSPEIPISDGPYKFRGLPGLIIQIQDDRNHYNYTLISVEKTKGSNSQSIVMADEDYIQTTKKELYSYKKEVSSSIFQKLEQKGISINFNNPSQKKAVLDKLSSRNNPIELILD